MADQSTRSHNISLSHFNILLANCRSVAPKIDEVRATCSTISPDIFACTESWLDSKHSDKDILVPNYHSFRHDRADRTGGGVIVFLKNCFKFNQFTPTVVAPEFIQCVFVAVVSIKSLFVCAYIPLFNSSNDLCLQINNFLTHAVDEFLDSFPDYNVILCADFNQFDTTTLISSLDLVELQSPATRGLARLDRFTVSSVIEHLCSTKLGPAIGNSDHDSLLFTFHVISNRTFKSTRVVDFRPRFVRQFISNISNVDWSVLDNCSTADSKCELFHTIFSDAMNVFPVYYVPSSSKDKPWITPLIKHLIHKRWDAFRRKDFQCYNRLKLLIRSKIDNAKRDWAHMYSTPSELWNKVNVLNSRNCNDSMDQLFNSYSNLYECSNVINDIFSRYFNNSMCSSDDFHKCLFDLYNYDCNWNLSITEEDVCNVLVSYDSRKAYGPDLVPTSIYKQCANVICKPLATIFNFCIQSCTFPSFWKHAHVIPLPKSSNPTVNDLRPISLLSLPSKVFECLMLKSVSHLFLNNFDVNQFGFRPKSSTCHALIKLHDHITKMLDLNSVSGVQVVALDYHKAFDSLDHKVIICKLLKCKFPIQFVKLMFSYLQNRTQSVRLKTVISKSAFVTSGVPQGSLIGPAIFALVMSDLNCVNSNTCMVKFADDVTLSIPIFHSTNSVHTEILNVQTWSSTVGLHLNYSKCKYLFVPSTSHATFVNIPKFSLCQNIKLLGIHFTNDLRWDFHFSYIRTVAIRRLYALRTLKPILSTTELRNIYMSLIVSIIEYCSPLFVGINRKNEDVIASIQRRFHNVICHLNCTCNILPDLTSRRVLASIDLYRKASSPDHLLFSIIPLKRTRFLQPLARTERRKRAFIPYTTELVNSKTVR